jgi:coatomer subunit beta
VDVPFNTAVLPALREKAAEYREMLIKTIHSYAVKFPECADSVVHLLMDFLGDDGAVDVMLFVRTIVGSYPALREGIIAKLQQSMDTIKTEKVFRIALWVLGEYSEEWSVVQCSLEAVMMDDGATIAGAAGVADQNHFRE